MNDNKSREEESVNKLYEKLGRILEGEGEIFVDGKFFRRVKISQKDIFPNIIKYFKNEVSSKRYIHMDPGFNNTKIAAILGMCAGIILEGRRKSEGKGRENLISDSKVNILLQRTEEIRNILRKPPKKREKRSIYTEKYIEAINDMKIAEPTLKMLEDYTGISDSTWSKLFLDHHFMLNLGNELKKRQSHRFSKTEEKKNLYKRAALHVFTLADKAYKRKMKQRSQPYDDNLKYDRDDED